MRWNPKRMQAIKANGGSGGVLKPKGVWNSLEVLKLIVGALTPALIAFIGVRATDQLHEQDIKRKEAEVLESRRSVLVPTMSHLLNADVKFADAVWEFDDAVPPLGRAASFDKIRNAAKKFGKAFNEHSMQSMEDWEKIRLLVHDDEFYMNAHMMYLKGYAGPMTVLSRVCVDTVLTDVGERKSNAIERYMTCVQALQKQEGLSMNCRQAVDLNVNGVVGMARDELLSEATKICDKSEATFKESYSTVTGKKFE